MKPIEIAFLLAGAQAPKLDGCAADLSAHLEAAGVALSPCEKAVREEIRLTGPAMDLHLSLHHLPLPAESFAHALGSPISRPQTGLLADIVLCHRRHMMLTLIPRAGKGAQMSRRETTLAALRAAHAAATALTRRHAPRAVHWRLSNQLLTGAQYLELAHEPLPWALLARARLLPGSAGSAGLRLEDATGLLDRPVLLRAGHRPGEEMHAAALSFLRHTIEHGAPVPDGHRFGPRGGEMLVVRYRAPRPGWPQGCHELTPEQARPEAPARMAAAARLAVPALRSTLLAGTVVATALLLGARGLSPGADRLAALLPAPPPAGQAQPPR